MEHIDDEGWIDLGMDHRFRWTVGDPGRYPTDDPRLADFHGEGMTLVGIIEEHADVRDPTKRCGGAVNFVRPANPSPHEADRHYWEVHSLDPLHIEPSVHCTTEKGGCGSHGYIREGRWANA